MADSSPVKLLRGAVGASFTSAGPSPLAAPVGLPGLHLLVMPAQATAVSNSGKQVHALWRELLLKGLACRTASRQGVKSQRLVTL